MYNEVSGSLHSASPLLTSCFPAVCYQSPDMDLDTIYRVHSAFMCHKHSFVDIEPCNLTTCVAVLQPRSRAERHPWPRQQDWYTNGLLMYKRLGVFPTGLQSLEISCPSCWRSGDSTVDLVIHSLWDTWVTTILYKRKSIQAWGCSSVGRVFPLCTKIWFNL